MSVLSEEDKSSMCYMDRGRAELHSYIQAIADQHLLNLLKKEKKTTKKTKNNLEYVSDF